MVTPPFRLLVVSITSLALRCRLGEEESIPLLSGAERTLGPAEKRNSLGPLTAKSRHWQAASPVTRVAAVQRSSPPLQHQ